MLCQKHRILASAKANPRLFGFHGFLTVRHENYPGSDEIFQEDFSLFSIVM